MDILTSDEEYTENFVIEKNVVKGAEIDYGFQNRNIGQLLLDIFNDNPDYTAWTVAESGKQVTYENMKDNSIRLALWMKQQGMGQCDIIALCSDNCVNNYYVMFATFYIGAIYNPWHHDFTLESACNAIKLTKPKMIFACLSIINTLTKAAKLENIDVKVIAYGNYPDVESIENILQIQKKEDIESFVVQEIENLSSKLAGIIFSSGTSGPPKGVMITYQSMLNFCAVITKVLKIKSDDILLWYSTPYWVVGTLFMISSILGQAKVIICQKFNPDFIYQLIEKNQVTIVIANPNFLTNLCKNKFVEKYNLRSLRKVIVGGTNLSKKTANQFRINFSHIDVFQVYGMTESPIVSIQTKKCNSSESVGFVLWNVQVKIVDLETKKLLGPNKHGEIYFRCPNMTVGYYNNAAATAETIDKDGWLHSGDIGYYDGNGEFFIVDRCKNVIRYRYHHVNPSEIAKVLLSHPEVLDVGITAFPDEADFEHAIAFVQRVPGAKVTEEELVELSAALGSYKKLWGGVKFVDRLPRTFTGKLSTHTLREMAKSYIQQ